MRVTVVVLSLALLLLAACTRPGDQSSMTPRDTSDTASVSPAAPAAPVDTATGDTTAAEPAPVRDVRTATFALG